MRVEPSLPRSKDDELPPVRTATKPVEAMDALKTIKPNSQRIASSDYNQWEKYDAGMKCVFFSSFLHFFSFDFGMSENS